jgi:AcrR family transcriptional regulator
MVKSIDQEITPSPGLPRPKRAGSEAQSPRRRAPGHRGGRRRRRNVAGDRARSQIVDAALRTLLAEGYAGASARSIATRGGFSPALVFYHVGSVDALLLAVVDRVSDDRLARYRKRLETVTTLSALASALEELYWDDLHFGHMTAVQEVVGAMAFDQDLGVAILGRMDPWFAFADELARRILDRTPLEGLIDASVIGSAVVALYLGLEIVARMRGGDTSGSAGIVATLTTAAPWVDRLLGKAERPTRGARPSRVAID